MKEKPEFWIIAGVNGAGKTTVVQQELKNVTNQITYINPDSFVKEIQQDNPSYNLDTANYAALKKAREILIQCLRDKQSVAVETTLSSSAYAKHAAFAKENGYQVNMLYVGLNTIELSVERVKERVASGGHDVPIDHIQSRWPKSHDNLAKFLPEIDNAFIYSNTLPGQRILVALKQNGKVHLLDPKALPEITKRLEPLIRQQEKALDAKDVNHSSNVEKDKFLARAAEHGLTGEKAAEFSRRMQQMSPEKSEKQSVNLNKSRDWDRER